MEKKVIISHVRKFYEIAQDSFETMNADMEKNIKAKPNGEKGNILTYEPEHTGFKNAIVSIVFCGVYLESIKRQLG